MDAEAQQALLKALQDDRLIDITTTGRKSGEPHRIEIGFHFVDGHVYITGRPGLRGWYANLLANPDFIGRYLEVYVWLAGVYWLVCTGMALLARHLEQQLSSARPAITSS